MKILVVSQYFYPENFRINQLCLDLKKRGHDVSVLTGKPNYPMGEYFDGYSFKRKEDEVWNDIPILRVPLRARGKGSLNLIRNYMSFVYHGNKRVRQLKENYDMIYVFEVSPMTVALPAIKFKKLKNIPIIINVQDLWPENIIAVTGIDNKLIIGIINKLVNYIYKKCDLILCASPSFVDKIKQRVTSKEKVRYWPQYSLVEETDRKSPKYDQSEFNITFTGNIGEAQGIDLAIKTAAKLRDTNIHWHFVGDGRNKEKMQDLVDHLKLNDRITFHGFVEEKEIPQYLSATDAALLILKPNPVFEMTIPAKLQTYLSCGVPIIGCVSGEGKKIIEEANCGLVSNDISSMALEKVCREMIEMSVRELDVFKSNSKKYGNKFFNKEKLIDQLEKFMEELK